MARLGPLALAEMAVEAVLMAVKRGRAAVPTDAQRWVPSVERPEQGVLLALAALQLRLALLQAVLALTWAVGKAALPPYSAPPVLQR
jgi:hypothetical protein